MTAGFRLAAGFGFAVAVAFGFGFGFGFAAAVAFGFSPRSRPKRVGRVSDRLPRTLWSSVVSGVIDQPVYVSLRALGALPAVDWVKPVAGSGVEGSWRSSPMEDFNFSA